MNWYGLWLPAAAALLAGAWLSPDAVQLPRGPSVGYRRFDPPLSHPPKSAVADDRPAFRLDPERPWRIDLGRGSGLYGLETVTLDQSGRIVLDRRTEDREGKVTVQEWETTEAVLPPEVVSAVAAAVASNRLTELHREYHADVWDGTQWVLRIRQGEHEKAVYFDNHFPNAVVRFAAQLDEAIEMTVGPRLRWQAVPAADRGGPQAELWESVRR